MVYKIWDSVYKIVQNKYKIMIYFSFTKSVFGGGGVWWHAPRKKLDVGENMSIWKNLKLQKLIWTDYKYVHKCEKMITIIRATVYFFISQLNG